MAIDVHEKWSVRTSDLPTSAQRGWTITGATDENAAIAALPIDGRFTGIHPQFGQMLVTGIKTSQPSPVGTYEILSTYTLPTGSDFGQLSPAKYSLEVGCESVPLLKDFYGNAITNAAGDPYEDLTREIEVAYLCVRRYESTFDLAKHVAYKDTFNNDVVNMPLVGNIDKGQARLMYYGPDEEWDRTRSRIWCLYRIKLIGGEVKDPDGFWDGHKTLVPNRGLNGWYSGPKKDRFYTVKHEQAATPVELDLNGQPVLSSTYKVGPDMAASIAAPARSGGDSTKIYSDSLAAFGGATAYRLKFTNLKPIAYSGLNLSADSI